MLIAFIHESLNTGRLSNEVIFEGCVKWQKILIFGNGFSSLGLALVIVLSLTKVNLHYKIGSTITVSSECYELNHNKNGYGDKTSARGINEAVYLESASIVNTETEEDLITIQGTIMSKLMYLKNILIKHGNLGKDKSLNLITNKIRILWGNLKDTVVYLIGYLEEMKSIVYDVLFSSLWQENNSIHGGKINKKANDLGNAKYTGKHSNRSTIWGQPRIVNIGQKLNSLYLNKTSLNQVRHYSTIKEESKLSVAEIKRLLIDNDILNWPNNKVLGRIYQEVFKKQMNLVKLADTYGVYSEEVYKEQLVLSKSLFFRIVAIDKLSKSPGSKTPGVDKVFFSNRKEDIDKYITLVKWLRDLIKDSNSYKAKPIRRVWIPKTNGQLRPLGIPTLNDRALQHLINLILEPLVESTGDRHSYGFRHNRSTKNAIAELRSQLKTIDPDKIVVNTKKSNLENKLYRKLSEEKWILGADIKGFFDNIDHNWLLDKLFINPKLRNIIKAWLKSGVMEKEIIHETNLGTPQGGIISPTLVNFTLNGLEKVILDSIKALTESVERRIVVKLKDRSKTRIASGLAYVRYADDFVVLARSKHIMITYVIPSIQEFLKPRGLTLNNNKTKLFRLKDKDTQLDFLGYTFKYQEKWRHNKHVFYKDHAGDRGIALYPNKTKMLTFIDKVRRIFKRSQNLDSYNLIAILNPILRGWFNYYNLGNSSHYRNTVRNAIYHLVWKWAHNKHRRWGKKRIASFYFLTHQQTEKNVNRKRIEYTMIKNVKWVFHGFANQDSRYGGKVKSRYLVDVGNSNQLLSSKHYIIPKKLLHVHAYHPDYMKMVEFNANNNFKAMGLNSSFKIKLLKV